MKTVVKPVEMVSWCNEDGSVTPVRFRLKDENQHWKIIKVEKICSVDKDKIAGNLMYTYKCQSIIGGELRPYELKYELMTCKWTLFKI